MTNCLLCQEAISQVTGLKEILSWSLAKPSLICDYCQTALQSITGPCCPQCGRSHQGLCMDCRRWQDQGWYFKNQALYAYNDTFRAWVTLLKAKGDQRLAGYFGPQLQQVFQKYPGFCLVPIPSQPLNRAKRGFNQTEAILNFSKLAYQPLLVGCSQQTGKQALKTRHERLHQAQPFKLAGNIQGLPDKVLLFDDIYTTGATLYQASQCLRQAGVVEVSGLTLAR
ncbi:hypothetical protein AWM75_05145 [Aerococcus urinaehominis]|uniref:Uncharacterized protein n=1 Tax=Aerococcus urinaehominis TaxID=128944 RepID=A0A0X8FLH3_9LACT|nr:ComF family protein [Aerococcus urinaehominis]AMB99417.1 hypothetical protein AWM75_05145 [Aerococcus urinaehominis]SDM29913.1 competence protein ComFC [Aerococcus urinaehominis]